MPRSHGVTAPAAALAVMLAVAVPQGAQAQSSADLQRQIDELKAQVQALTTALAANRAAPPAVTAAPASGEAPITTGSATALAAAAPQPAAPAPVHETKPKSKAWYDRITLRGYTQLRYNAFLDGDKTAPAGVSRLRSVHDSSISDRGNFSLRRARLILQGDISDRVSLYFQSDFASAVNNQSGTERREHFVQLRDAYADVFLDKAKTLRLRLGQSKVPYGWENMQSSSNRLTLDRSDGINSAVPSERDLGIIAYYTPPSVQKIWDRLSKDGQKLFGNYGAFGVGIFNGQGINRTEQNQGLMKVAFATWPFEIGDQVVEIGGSAMLNKVQPEIRSGGVSPVAFDDNRVAVHAMIYPQPFGIQAEWNWGKGPEWDRPSASIQTKNLSGGYVQAMYKLDTENLGTLFPYGRWQHYRGGWKTGTSAPRLETDEFEVGIEWQPWKALEVTLAYARMKRTEADERRIGRAEGSLFRSQIQWNY